MNGVIIAAGRGERLSSISGGTPKTLIEINGKPIIRWIIDNLRSIGVNDIFIVVGYAREKIEAYFKKTTVSGIHFVFNDKWEKGNGISVLSVSEYLSSEEPFLLAMSDHLIERKALEAFAGMKEQYPLLLVDPDLHNVFDLEDATKVMVTENRITDIGKEISQYNGVDAGVFLLDKRIFRFLREAVAGGEESLTSGIKRMIKEYQLTAVTMPEDVYWIDIDSEDAYKNAMNMWRCL